MATTRDSITGPNGTSRAEVMRALIGCCLTTENNPKNGFDFIFSSFFSFSLSFSLFVILPPIYWKRTKYQHQFQHTYTTPSYSILSTPPYFTSMCQSAPSFPSSALLLPAGCLANSACCYSDFPPASLTPIDVDSEIDLGSAVADLSPRRTRVSSFSNSPRLQLESFLGETIWVGVLGPS